MICGIEFYLENGILLLQKKRYVKYIEPLIPRLKTEFLVSNVYECWMVLVEKLIKACFLSMRRKLLVD